MEEDIIKFLAQEIGLKPERITLDSDLSRDLGVAGDSGFELMRKFAKKYSVNLEGFTHTDYFGKEGGNPLMLILPSLRPTLKSITVGDLIIAARAGVWKRR